MDTFFTAVPYVLIFAQALCPMMLARHYAKSQRVGSKWTLALLAALPIPALLAGFSIFSFMDVLIGRRTACHVDSCGSDSAALTTLMFSALALYLFGIFNAAMGYRSGKVSEGRRSE